MRVIQSVQIGPNDLDWPVCLLRLFSPIGAGLTQHAPTKQGNLELSLGIDYRYVIVWFHSLKMAQMILIDMSFYFAFFHLLVDVHPTYILVRIHNELSPVYI
jgi:hypothetical protein